LAFLDLPGLTRFKSKLDATFKKTQTAVSDPGASGTATAFISGITQNAQGVITPSKKNLPSASTSAAGIVQLNNSLDSTSTTQAATASAVAALNSNIAKLQNELGIVCNGNKCTVSATTGQYIILKNSTISGCADGLYTATQAIPANTAITSAYLSAVSNGGLNALNDSKADKENWINGANNHAVEFRNANGAVSMIVTKAGELPSATIPDIWIDMKPSGECVMYKNVGVGWQTVGTITFK